MCNCIQETKDKVVTMMNKNLSERGVRIVSDSFKSTIEGQIFRFDGSDNTVPAITVNAEYKQLKVDNTPMKSVRKLSMPVFGTHCPFCGEEHEKVK